MMNNEFIILYTIGIKWSIILGISIAILFAKARWIWCIKKYIETGVIDTGEDSSFFSKNNWFWGHPMKSIGLDKNNKTILRFYYGNNPWMVAIDIITISFVSSLLSIIWPISIIVMFAIIFAKWRRNIVVKKAIFLNNLKGKHV